jgi:hypothetical protein
MHCLFLGIAKWIVTRLWIEENRLTKKHLEIMQERANKIKVPSDMGRIPNKIATGEGFSGFTADQWKTFILIYATTITWDLLKDDDRKILSYFVRACNILICRIISKSGLNEAHNCLLSMVKLVESSYGAEKITPNMHLCLHICECALDYGPLYSFWCYSFERMNGLLGKQFIFLYHTLNFEPLLFIIQVILIFYNIYICFLQVRCTVVIGILNQNCLKLFSTIQFLMNYRHRMEMKISTFRLACHISLSKKVLVALQLTKTLT